MKFLLVLLACSLALTAAQPNPKQCYADPTKPDGKFNDGNAACTCTQVPDALDTGVGDGLTVPTLLFGDGKTQLTGDVLTLQFYAPVKYYNFAFQPPQAGSDCEHADWGWQEAYVDQNGDVDPTGCYIRYTGTLNWAQAYQSGTANGCGFTRDDTDADFIKLKLDWEAKFNEDLADLDTTETNRDTQNGELRELEFKFPIVIEFPKQQTATSGDIVVFSPHRILSSIPKIDISGDPIQGQEHVTATVDLFTSIQWPFKLTTWANNAADKTNDNIVVNSVTEPNFACDAGTSCDVNAWKDGQEDATCPVCEQTIQFSLTPVAAPEQCNFDGQYGVDFKIECHSAEPAASSCPLSTQADTTGNIKFTIETSSHCPVTVDVVTFTTKELLTYEDAARLSEKDDFLDGQTIYFKANFVTDDVTVNAMEINTISLLRPNRAAKEDLLLYTKAGGNTDDGTALQLRNLQNSGITPPSGTSSPQFDLTVDSLHLGLVADEREIVRFQLIVDVVYANAGQAVKRTHKIDYVHSQAASGGRRPSESAAIANIGGTGSASTSNMLFGVASGTVAVGAAAVGFLAAVSIGVIMIRGRRRRSIAKANIEEMEMQAAATEESAV